jgi:mannose-6-phosphate isomerase-like protein (cupin superfamily)
MKPTKYSKKDITKIDLGTKTILKYPTSTKLMDVAKMVVRGRHPQKENAFINEKECNFIMYITSGKGTVYAGDEVFEVTEEDVVIVPKGNDFAVEGELEYITFDTPAFYLEQATEIQK